MRRLLLITCSLCLYTGAVLGAGTARRPVTDFARDLSRPFVTPTLWRSLAAAERQGTVGEIIAKGRALMHYFPDWVDGHFEFAWQLAIDASVAAETPAAAARLLQSGLDLLDDAVVLQRTEYAKARLRMAQAVLVHQRTDADDAVAAAVERLLGATPGELYDRYYTAALEFHDVPSIRSQLAYFSLRQIERELRRKRPIGQILARITRTAAYLRQLDEVSARANAGALDRLATALPHILSRTTSRAQRDAALRDLVAAEPLLADISAAIQKR